MLVSLRILTISAIRHGAYPPETRGATHRGDSSPRSPARTAGVNEELVAMCAALRSRTFIHPALDLLAASRTQEEQVHYTRALIGSAEYAGWTPELRERLLMLAIERVPNWKGGSKVGPLRVKTLQAVVAMLTDDQRTKFADRIAAAINRPLSPPVTSRSFVKNWTLEDLAPALEQGLKDTRDLENGRMLFTATACIACHTSGRRRPFRPRSDQCRRTLQSSRPAR